MDLLFVFSCLLYFIPISASLSIILVLASGLKSPSSKLPPGRKGWPVIGETLEFGNPEKFIKDRMSKYSPEVFQTCLMGENMAVMCGASGNKFLFSNEDKLVTSWWPSFMKKILYSPSLFDKPSTEDNLMKPHSSLHQFLKPEALKHYVEIMDMLAHKHIDIYWASNKEVKVYPLSKKYSFFLSCRLFMNIQDPEFIGKISDNFDRITSGLFSLPIDIHGTTFNHGIKARKNLHKEIGEIIRKRKKELVAEDDHVIHDDLLSQMLLMSDENSKVMSEMEITTRINTLLLGSHETTSRAITFVLNYLAEFPDVYNGVLKGDSSKPFTFFY